MNDDDLKLAASRDMEIINLQHGLKLLRSQLNGGNINRDFMLKQLDKLDDFLQKVNTERQHHSDSARFEALYNVSRILGISLDIQTVLDQVMDAIIKLTGAERGFLMLRDDDGGLQVKAARNLDQQTLSSNEFKFSRTVTNHVLDAGEGILTTNATQDPRFAGQASIVAQALRSIMATPLRARGRVIGVAYVDSRAMAGLFKEKDLEALDAFSAQAAIALDNAILFSETDEELARRVDELRELRRIDLLLNATLNADKAMAYTLEWVCRMCGAASGYLGLIEGKPPRVKCVQAYGLPTPPELYLDEAYPQVKALIKSRHSTSSPQGGGEQEKTLLIVPIRREQQVIGAVILQKDDPAPFTEEKQDLAERIVARAAVAIENARLYAAVQAADKAKSEFVGIVAHDLKSPMTGIKGYSEVMLMEPHKLDPRHIEFLNRIKNTVHRMEVLVSDLADISRIESGHFFMDEIRVPVASVVQAVKDSTLPQIEARAHCLVVDIEDNLPDLWVDYYRLLQVLTNLVSNAYKYTPNGGTITLSVCRQTTSENDSRSDSRPRVQFSIQDTGIGLSAEDIERLGTKFWRADDDFTRSQPGTGLGFSITQALVQQMGSEIDIESSPGAGSAFTFSVAIMKDQAKDAPLPLASSG